VRTIPEMTAKEPRPASHFRLVLQGVEGAGLAKFGPGQLIFPVIGAQPEVKAFSADTAVADPADQDAVDRVSDKIQALYDGLEGEERLVLEQIMAQAASYAWSESG